MFDTQLGLVLPSPGHFKQVPVKLITKDPFQCKKIAEKIDDFAAPSPRIRSENKDSITTVTMKLQRSLELIEQNEEEV